MNKSVTNLLRSAFVAVCCLCGIQASFAVAEAPTIATGGSNSDAFNCTVGEAFVSASAGMWGDPVDLTSTGVNGIYSDGDIVVENVAGDKALNIQLPDELIAAGATYNVFTISGMLLESNQITSNPYSVNYSDLLTGQCIIVTINTKNGVVATLKITK